MIKIPPQCLFHSQVDIISASLPRPLHQPPAVVEVISLLSRVSLDYRVRVAHLVAAARSGGAGEWRAKCNSN